MARKQRKPEGPKVHMLRPGYSYAARCGRYVGQELDDDQVVEELLLTSDLFETTCATCRKNYRNWREASKVMPLLPVNVDRYRRDPVPGTHSLKIREMAPAELLALKEYRESLVPTPKPESVEEVLSPEAPKPEEPISTDAETDTEGEDAE